MKICEVCEREREVEHRSSGLGPVSINICYECQYIGAEPLRLCKLAAELGRRLDDFRYTPTWKDGKYVTRSEALGLDNA